MSDEQQDQQEQREADEQDQHSDDTHDADLGDAGKAALKREREARKAAEKARADLQKQLDDIAKKQKDAEDEAARQQGEWEKIATQREKELKDLQDKLAARELADMRREVAKETKLPDDLVEFVQGDTREDMEASAKALVKHLKPVDAPDTDAGRRGQGGGKRRDDAEPYRFGTRPI